jgi:hypothetical protein
MLRMEMVNVKLKYDHPASCPKGIYMNKVYELGKDKKGDFLECGTDKVYMRLDKIKAMFKIMDGDFTVVEKSVEEVEVEDKIEEVEDDLLDDAEKSEDTEKQEVKPKEKPKKKHKKYK